MDEGWDGRERRAGPDPEALQNELKAVRQDVGRLAVAVTTLGSDDKLQAAVDSVAEEQKRHWQRLLAIVVVGLAVVGALALVGLLFADSARDAAQKAAVAAKNSEAVAGYVDHCLVHPDRATPGECGNTAATGAQSTAVLAIFCYLQIDPAVRDDVNARDCFVKAAAQARADAAAATTTTTR